MKFLSAFIFLIGFYAHATDKIRIYFNHSIDTTVSNGVNSISLNQLDDTLIAYLNRAKFTIDIAVYSLNLNNIVNAINDAYGRGVAIRIIADSSIDTFYYNAINVGGNKKMRPDSISGAMHNKFIIIDANSINSEDAIIWTGSANFTYSQMKVDANNVVIIQDKNLSLAYQTEFDEMWNGSFGTYKNDNTAHEFIIDGKRVELYFSPSDTVNKKITAAINTIDKDLEFAMFNFTSQYLANAVASKTSTGIFLAGIIEDTAYGTSPYNTMYAQMNSRLLIDQQNSLLHHKYAIIDANEINSDPMVITGSHNWTISADTRNDENTLIIHDDTIANLFYQEWTARYKENGGSILLRKNEQFLLENNQGIVNVFPNPADQKLFIRSSEKASIVVFDILGNIILQTSLLPNQTSSFDLSALAKGIYLAKALMKENLTVKKIVKN